MRCAANSGQWLGEVKRGVIWLGQPRLRKTSKLSRRFVREPEWPQSFGITELGQVRYPETGSVITAI